MQKSQGSLSFFSSDQCLLHCLDWSESRIKAYILGDIEKEDIDALLELADELIREDEEAINEYEEREEDYLLNQF